MNLLNYWRIIISRWKSITIITSVVVLIVLIYTLMQPFQYQSTVQLLVIQNTSSGLDPYTAIKSAERIGETLVRVVYTSSFIDKVENPSLLIADIFPTDPIEVKKSWQKMVNAYVISGNGIIQIEAYHPEQKTSLKIARAVANALITQSDEYLGGGNSVEVKLIDSPLTSRYPVRPNIFLNLGGSLVLGLLFSGCYVFLTTDSGAPAAARLDGSNKPLTLPVKILSRHDDRRQKINLAHPSTEVRWQGVAPAAAHNSETKVDTATVIAHKAVIHNFFTEQLIEDHYLKSNPSIAASSAVPENQPIGENFSGIDFPFAEDYNNQFSPEMAPIAAEKDVSRVVDNLPIG